MKRFRFSLEALQTVRDRATSKALECYARAIRAQNDAEQALTNANDSLAAHLEAWRKAMARGFNPQEMLGMEHARAALQGRRDQCAQTLREATASAAKALAELQLAQQKSEVVERFHDRKKNEFNLALLKEEQHFLDELATNRRGSGGLGRETVYA